MGGTAPPPSTPATALPMQAQRAPAQSATTRTATAMQTAATDGPDAPSILSTLKKETTIGSTVDPVTGDQNPYGLDIAPITSGKFDKGDLVVCDFNDSANVQGTGNSIIALSPVAVAASKLDPANVLRVF